MRKCIITTTITSMHDVVEGLCQALRRCVVRDARLIDGKVGYMRQTQMPDVCAAFPERSIVVKEEKTIAQSLREKDMRGEDRTLVVITSAS